jgi:hypothetical protein
VIAAAGLIMAATAGRANIESVEFWTCIVAVIACAAVKLRLPGLNAAFALTYLPIMYSCMHGDLAQTVLVAAAGGLAQSYLNFRTRPTFIQALFNSANLVVSVGISYASTAVLASLGVNVATPSVEALLVACYFAVNTTAVSGVLALLKGTKLSEVCGAWYNWSLPYYLIGASLVATLFPLSGTLQWEGSLITVTLLALVQFYAVAREVPRLNPVAGTAKRLNRAAYCFAAFVCSAAAAFFFMGALTASSADIKTFLIYVLATTLVSTWKVRLPDLQGTLSLNFVLLLVAITHLSLLEVGTLAVIAAVTQSVWRPASRPAGIQVVFSAATLVVGACLAHQAVRILFSGPDGSFVMAAVIVAAIILYLSNTWLITMMIALVQGRSGSYVWLRCQFWTFAFYTVGASAAVLIGVSARIAGLLPALLMLPLMYLTWLSYRAQVVSGPQPEQTK